MILDGQSQKGKSPWPVWWVQSFVKHICGVAGSPVCKQRDEIVCTDLEITVHVL
jgi:hypothetical protein